MKRRGLFLTFAALLVIAVPFAAGQRRTDVPPEYQDRIPDFLKERVQHLGGPSSFILAEAIGVTEVMGKSINATNASHAFGKISNSSIEFEDVGIGVHATKHENEPTVVANPKNRKNLVAGSHYFGPPAPEDNRCVAYYSFNGGTSWSSPIIMPSLDPLTFHSDPVLAFAPDGKRVYFAYMDIKQIFDPSILLFTIDLDIVVSYSNNGGRTWTGPIVALDGAPTIIDLSTGTVIAEGFEYDKPWIGTHVEGDNDNNKNYVYVTATRFDDFDPFDCNIAFARSGDRAATWSSPVILDKSTGGCGNPVVVQGSRPTGGLKNSVLTAWYHSGTDGWLEGRFQIKTRHSSNNGTSWASIVTAASDQYEAPFWLGPDAFYHRWWGVMFPDPEIDEDGKAHIVYTHDPEQFSSTAEEGDIRYIHSRNKKYNSWTKPVTLNDDGLLRAQGYAALETRGDKTEVHVIWEDHRFSPEVPAIFPDSPNLFYDMVYASVKKDDDSKSANHRVTSASSINDFIFIGDYNDLTTNDKKLIVGAFTDRRDKTSIFDFEDDVFGVRITDDDNNDFNRASLPAGESPALPASHALAQNNPNPFNPSTQIRFQLPEANQVVMKIFNILGEEVRTLVDSPFEAGDHVVQWDGKNDKGKPVASGVYLYQLQAGSFKEIKRMSLVH